MFIIMSQKSGQLSSSRGINSLSSFDEAVLRDDCGVLIVPACDVEKIKALILVYDIDKELNISYCHPRRLNLSIRASTGGTINIGLDHRLIDDMEASIKSCMGFSFHIPTNSLVVVGVTYDDDLIKSNPLIKQRDTITYDYAKVGSCDESMYSYAYNPYDTKYTL